MNLPHIQLYPGDWLKDSVSGASLAAQGLWLRLLFVMQESPYRGILCQPTDQHLPDFCLGKNEASLQPLPPSYLCRRVGATEKEYELLMAELFSLGVPSRTKNGVIYSRRMVKDEALRRVRSQAGKQGAKVSLLNQNRTLRSDFASAKRSANADNDNDNGTGPDLSICTEGLDELKRLTARWLNLEDERAWTYEEERLMAGIVKRKGFPQEVAALNRFHSTQRKFFAQSSMSLLEKWDHHVQRARNGQSDVAAPKPRVELTGKQMAWIAAGEMQDPNLE